MASSQSAGQSIRGWQLSLFSVALMGALANCGTREPGGCVLASQPLPYCWL